MEKTFQKIKMKIECNKQLGAKSKKRKKKKKKSV